jgi:hypothetical protein
LDIRGAALQGRNLVEWFISRRLFGLFWRRPWSVFADEGTQHLNDRRSVVGRVARNTFQGVDASETNIDG